MRREMAEGLARDVLLWLMQSDDLLGVFLGATGAAPTDLRHGAQDPVFLGSVLDFLLMDDAWIAQFCDQSGYPPAAPREARAALPGGDAVHWT